MSTSSITTNTLIQNTKKKLEDIIVMWIEKSDIPEISIDTFIDLPDKTIKIAAKGERSLRGNLKTSFEVSDLTENEFNDYVSRNENAINVIKLRNPTTHYETELNNRWKKLNDYANNILSEEDEMELEREFDARRF
jgi:hypothetical protein